MDQKTKTKNHSSSKEYSLEYLKSLPLWNFIEQRIELLVENQDLQLTTFQDAVVSYLVKEISKNKDTLFPGE